MGSSLIWARLTEEGSRLSVVSGAVGGGVLVACSGAGRGGKSRGVIPGIIPSG